MSVHFTPANYNSNQNFSQLSNLEIAVNNGDIETLNKIVNSDEFIHFPLSTVKHALQIAIEKNQFNSIEALLNSNRSQELSSESLGLLLTHDDMHCIKRIIDSNVFNEIPIEALKKALNQLILQNKLSTVKLILNTFRFYEFDNKEILTLLEAAVHNNNIDLLKVILDCEHLEEIPEDTFKKCLAIAEDKRNIEIIKLLLNSRKTCEIPKVIFYKFENACDNMSIEIAQAFINSRKFDRISTKSLERAFKNANSDSNQKKPLVRYLLNSKKANEISVPLLQENSNHKAVKHYLNYLGFHRDLLVQKTPLYTKQQFFDDDSAIEIIYCKKCNRESSLSITTLTEILHHCITHNRQELLQAIFDFGRINEIGDDDFTNLLEHALEKIDIINKFIDRYPEKSQRTLHSLFENVIFNNKIKIIKNLLPLTINLPFLDGLKYAVQENNLPLLEVILSSNKISQEDLYLLIHYTINNIILNPKDDLVVKIFHKLISHYDPSLSNLKSILTDHQEKNLLLLHYALKEQLIKTTRKLLLYPTFSRDFIKLFLEEVSLKNDSSFLFLLLSQPEFSTEELSPLLEIEKIAYNLNIIQAFIISNKITIQKMLELFDYAVENSDIRILSIISSSSYISNIPKEHFVKALRIASLQDDDRIIEALTSRYLSEDELANISLDLPKEDSNIIQRLLSSGALTPEKLKSLGREIPDPIQAKIEEYNSLQQELLKPLKATPQSSPASRMEETPPADKATLPKEVLLSYFS